MVDIIEMRQLKRARDIDGIMKSVEKAVEDNNPNFDFKSIVLSAMANLNLSERTTREYVKVAYFKLGMVPQ